MATLGLLGGLTAQKLSYSSPAGVEEYHQSVRIAIEAIPSRIGLWIGEDIKVPQAALALLRPNGICSRRYTHQKTNQNFQLLVLHCRDARDMQGHYPPVCYPAQGWTLRTAQPTEWIAGGLVIPAMIYEFDQAFPTYSIKLVIANVLILPDGSMPRDIAGVRTLAADYTMRNLGAGQIQIVFHAYTKIDQYDEIIQTVLNENHNIITNLMREIIHE